MTFLELAKSRYSVRSFRPDPIDDEKMAKSYYTNGNFQGITGPLDFFRYDIDVYRNNPAPNTYYSTSDPFPSNKAIMMTSGPNGAGAHFVEYTIVAYRKSNNKRVTIEDSTFLDLA